MKRFRSHLTFANVASVMALFIALGGTAYGVAKNSIGSKQIRNKQVKKVDLHRNAVTGPKVANNAIASKEVRANSITGEDIDEASLDSSIQRSLSNVCSAGQAIRAITPQGAVNCEVIPGSVSLGALQGQVDALTSQLNALAPQVAALCGSIRTAIDTNFDSLDNSSVPVTGTLPLVGVVAGLLNAGLPNLNNSLPACP
jgi:hypothetical protein